MTPPQAPHPFRFISLSFAGVTHPGRPRAGSTERKCRSETVPERLLSNGAHTRERTPVALRAAAISLRLVAHLQGGLTMSNDIVLVHQMVHGRPAVVGPKKTLICDRPSKALSPAVNSTFFIWSGGNTHGARMRAGEKLREYLEALEEAHPGSQKTIVSHSHGGNVSLYALRAIKGGKGHPRLACFGTPFIQCVERGRLSSLIHLASGRSRTQRTTRRSYDLQA